MGNSSFFFKDIEKDNNKQQDIPCSQTGIFNISKIHLQIQYNLIPNVISWL